MDFRHEYKHEINPQDLLILRQRLRALLQPDPHAQEGRYQIRSLYFDNAADSALREKLDGICRREKFRLRCYNGDSSLIHLEKKAKLGDLRHKDSCALSRLETERLLAGERNWMAEDSRPLVRELYSKMCLRGLRLRTLVDYTREPFVYGPGHVRVTLDYDIRSGLSSTDFLRADCVTIPVREAPIILEVKWDEFLPSIVQDAVQLGSRHSCAFSKYAACRVYD